MAKHIDPTILAHLEWLGFVRPTGLVVSAPALVRAGAILPRNDAEGQRLLASCLVEQRGTGEPMIADFHVFARTVLGWSFTTKGYAGVNVSTIPSELQVSLLEYGETLSPDLAVRELEPGPNASPWQLLVQLLPAGQELDRVTRGHGRLEAAPHGRMERLLRQSGVSAGLLFNGSVLRLISAPRGESSGWLDFRVADMVQTAGRPIVAALRLLLNQQRLLALPRGQRLAALLEESRKFQNEVSERLAEQVLHALYALLRGFQAANDDAHGALLRGPMNEDPDAVYRALLTVILRLIFLLYAEERDMLPADETFLRNYSLAGLYERLREDAALYPDTMQQRYGAWAQLLVLFRMIHDGAKAGDLHLPKRHGVLFDPNRFPFLEGRTENTVRQIYQRIIPPRVPDGTIYQALEKLLLLDSERISYRALDVEQIGSVYETMMGFRLETAKGRALAIRANKKGGAPTTINLDVLLNVPHAQRARWLEDQTERSPSDGVKSALQATTSTADLHNALRPLIDTAATPDIVPKGAMVLQPSEERRRSGSHYTPRTLTEPIVRTTLEPILARLRGSNGLPPQPAQILDMKICDPAMGSGAFLVEACRQLGDALVEAWHAHDEKPSIPSDEDEVVYARRLVAQRCLYGVDKNPTAVDLAKVSLWLVTLAKEHPLTFVDHALRHGDSLVGLSRRQIETFHWQGDAPRFQAGFEAMRVRKHVDRAAELRAQIRHASEQVSDAELSALWGDAQDALAQVRLYGDLVLAAFFEGSKEKERESKRLIYAAMVLDGSAEQQRVWLEDWRGADPPLVPFHWEIEFPEVFQRANSGFDAVVGNPPFLGGSKLSRFLGDNYRSYLFEQIAEHTRGKGDLVAYFVLRCFKLLRTEGNLGMVVTTSLAEGDSRAVCLDRLTRGKPVPATIIAVIPSMTWPGAATVTVSCLWLHKGEWLRPVFISGEAVNRIGPDFRDASRSLQEPIPLSSNANRSWRGTEIKGPGFVLSDEEAKQLLMLNAKNSDIIFKYLTGSDINGSPHIDSDRWVINFHDWPKSRAQEYPECFTIVTDKVKPYRDTITKQIHEPDYWKLWDKRTLNYQEINRQDQVLVLSLVTKHVSFAFVVTGQVFSNKVQVFTGLGYDAFAILQSSLHFHWCWRFSPRNLSLLAYSPRTCFETFPFPCNFIEFQHLNEINQQATTALWEVGATYYASRATMLVTLGIGLTELYNRFHDPYEQHPEIEKLRELHAMMDRSVLNAYGWQDIPSSCEFLPDYEIAEDEQGNKKKPYRYRWPDAVRDEVLTRLLELNAQRVREEKLVGQTKVKGSGKQRKVVKGMQDMFE